jgi:hypothetical protein
VGTTNSEVDERGNELLTERQQQVIKEDKPIRLILRTLHRLGGEATSREIRVEADGDLTTSEIRYRRNHKLAPHNLIDYRQAREGEYSGRGSTPMLFQLTAAGERAVEAGLCTTASEGDRFDLDHLEARIDQVAERVNDLHDGVTTLEGKVEASETLREELRSLEEQTVGAGEFSEEIRRQLREHEIPERLEKLEAEYDEILEKLEEIEEETKNSGGLF